MTENRSQESQLVVTLQDAKRMFDEVNSPNLNLQEYLEALERHNYKGYLGQELTEFDYFEDPLSIDRKNMAAYESFIR